MPHLLDTERHVFPARLRGESLALLASLIAADRARSAAHSELGRVTLGEMVHEWAAHALTHIIQVGRAPMQPFIAGSGPWRSSFADHDMSNRANEDARSPEPIVDYPRGLVPLIPSLS